MGDRFPYARYFGEIKILAALQVMPGDAPYVERDPEAPVENDLLLYLGCNVLRTAHLARTAMSVLRAMGFAFNAVAGPGYCCGVVHWVNGDTGAADSYARQSLRHMARFAPKHMIVWCPSCQEHYDDVVARAHPVPFPYEHMTGFVARHLDRIRFVRRVERRVALHYHAGHPQQERDRSSVRAILQAIPGLEYREIDNPVELGRHCGSVFIDRIGRRVWRQQMDRVLAAARAADVDTLATIYHSCHREICGDEAETPFEIVNYITLLGEAMGIEHPDVYKRYRLMADPEAIMDDARCHVEAHALDRDEVRKVVNRTFARD